MNRRRQALLQIVEAAKEMLAGQIGAIQGSRRISRLYGDVGADEDSVFLPFRAIDSESDTLVVGDRSLFSPTYLDEMDRRYARYEEALAPDIAAHCEALLAAIAGRIRECLVCGFSPLTKPPYDVDGLPSYEECRCCEFQPGVTDEIGYDVAAWRKRWIAKGMPFCQPPMPRDWDASEQLRRAGLSDARPLA